MTSGLQNDSDAMQRLVRTIVLLKLRESEADLLVTLADYLYVRGVNHGLDRAKAAIGTTTVAA